MHWVTQSTPVRLTALAVALLLSTSDARATTRPTTVAPSSSETVTAPSLTPAENRRAEAIAHYLAGLSIEMREGPDAALDEYLKSVELDPQNVDLTSHIAETLLRRKDYAKALSLMEQSVKANPNSAEAWNILAVVLRANDQIPQAMNALRQAMKLEPSNLNSVQTLLDIYLQIDDVAGAAKLLAKARKQQSTDFAYWIRLGDFHSIAVRQKPPLSGYIKPSDIQDCYERAEALAPNEPDIILRLASLYETNDNLSRAAEAYARYVAMRPNELPVRAKLANTYIAAGEKEKAIAELQEIIKREPLRYEIHNLIGDLYEDVKQDEHAISAYRESLVLNPNQLEPALRIALVQMRIKQYDDAVQTLAGLKDKFPGAYQIPYFYGLVYSDKKDYARAVVAYTDAEVAARKSPEEVKLDASFYFYYGAACERNGDLDRAEQLFRKSIELDSNKHEAFNYLGYMWADKGIRLDEAHEMIDKAVKLEPDNGAYLDSLGWVLYKQGHPEEALPILRRAAELIKDDAVVYDHLAEVLMKLGQRSEAVATLQRALKAEPENKDIAEKLQKLSDPQTGTR